METVELPKIPDDLVGQVIMHVHRLRTEVLTAKNLVNGKPIDADRKLQGILTKFDNLLSSLIQARDTDSDKLADPSDAEDSSAIGA
jgi:hypothetical protein